MSPSEKRRPKITTVLIATALALAWFAAGFFAVSYGMSASQPTGPEAGPQLLSHGGRTAEVLTDGGAETLTLVEGGEGAGPSPAGDEPASDGEVESAGDSTGTVRQEDLGPEDMEKIWTSLAEASQTVTKDWKNYKSSKMAIRFRLPPEVTPDMSTTSEQYFAFINYPSGSIKGGEAFPTGKYRVEIENIMKSRTETIEDYLAGFTSSSENVEREAFTIHGLPGLHEMGVDGGLPYEFYYIDRGETILRLANFGSQDDVQANRERLAMIMSMLELD